MPAQQQAARARTCGPALERGARRQRLGPERPEDLEHRRALLRLGHDRVRSDPSHRSTMAYPTSSWTCCQGRRSPPIKQSTAARASTRCSSATFASRTRARRRRRRGLEGLDHHADEQAVSIGAGTSGSHPRIFKLAQKCRRNGKPAIEDGAVRQGSRTPSSPRRASSTPAIASSALSRGGTGPGLVSKAVGAPFGQQLSAALDLRGAMSGLLDPLSHRRKRLAEELPRLAGTAHRRRHRRRAPQHHRRARARAAVRDAHGQGHPIPRRARGTDEEVSAR